jgi:DNA polymerase gamma 1
LLQSKKGVSRNGLYEGGLDSGCFNYMEEIAMRSQLPTLPCLKTKISTAMRPSAVGDDFKTGRVNWTIQSSGAEILSIMLTAVHWLAEEYKIPCRFILSIHDEIWFMTPERYAEQFAVLFQIAHLYTWSLFHSAVGIPDLPLSRAFFSSVAIDDRLRKSPKEKTITISHPLGGEEPFGKEFTMTELSEIGAIDKLKTRYQAIQKGVI